MDRTTMHRKEPKEVESPLNEWWLILNHSSSGNRMKKVTQCFLVLVVVVCFVNLTVVSDLTGYQQLLATLVIVIAVIPTFLWLSGKGHTVAFLPLFGAAFAIHYAFPILVLEEFAFFQRNRGYSKFPDYVVDQALLLTLMAIIALFISYYVFPGERARSFTPKLELRWWNFSRVKGLAFVFLFAGSLILAVRMVVAPPRALQTFVDLGTDLFFVGLAVLFICQLLGWLGNRETIIFWVLVLSRIFMGISMGSVGEVLRVVLPIALIYATIKRRIPWKIILVFSLLFFVLRPIKGTVEIIYARSGGAFSSGKIENVPIDRVLRYLNGAFQLMTGRVYGGEIGNWSPSDFIRKTWGRLSYSTKLSQVVLLTPAEIPFWEGESYYPMLFKPIPRFLFPGKPVENFGMTFGPRYRFVHGDDTKTYVTIPFLVEFYANFGYTGVVVGMFLVGILIRLIESTFFHPKMGFGALVAGLFILSGMGDLQFNLSAMYGRLLYFIPFFVLINYVMLGGRSRRRRDETGALIEDHLVPNSISAGRGI